MKYTYEKLKNMSNEMNELWVKCDHIFSIIQDYVIIKERELINKGELYYLQLQKIKCENPFCQEYLNIYSFDEGFYLTNKTISISGATFVNEDRYVLESNFTFNIDWLNLEGEELRETLKEYAYKLCEDELKRIKSEKEINKNPKIEKAKELLNELSYEEISELLEDVLG